MQLRRFSLPIALAAGVIAAAGASAEPVHLVPPGLSTQHPAGAFLLRFDENGNATVAVDGGASTPLHGTLLPDPANTDCPTCLALTYLLPESVSTGDVEVFDPDGVTTSDWLRFTDDTGDIAGDPAGAGVRLIYYSLFGGPTDTALADVPFPDNIGSQNSLSGPSETVSDGTSTFDYQPAGVPYPANNEYIGISDEAAAVPEPASLVLLGSAAAAMGVLIRRRRSRGAAARV